MNASTACGEWVMPHVGTGSSRGFVRMLGWTSAALLPILAATGTGSDLQASSLTRRLSCSYALDVDVVEAMKPRTPSEDLARICEVLSPAVSDLAGAFGVTRQTIYNWRNGDSISPEKTIRLRNLAQAADVLAEEGVIINSTLLKRKFFEGKSLFQVAQSGGSIRDAAFVLVQVSKREAEQKARMEAHFARRVNTRTSADFDFPSADVLG